jgi:hypothetical protein
MGAEHIVASAGCSPIAAGDGDSRVIIATPPRVYFLGDPLP